ncbi:zinc finger protein 346-like [Aphidius gifuensis]|uniref:zinc finger protein 346-like n=1 Tax=Aphidius gifuensis TaxID=684658 RepID=UPI001CDB5938|nr:zinc finger protein 346-like [Aphidius gifuensis]
MSKINMIENPEVPGFEVSLPPMPPPPPPPIISRKHPNDLIKQTTLAVPSLPIAPGITLVDSQPILPNEQVGFDNILEPQSQVTPWWIPEENEEINNYQWLDNNQVNNVLNNINNDIKTNQKNVKRKIENVDAAEDAQLVACAQKELAALMEPLKCNLCNAIMNSTPQAKLHYDGKPHQKKVSMYLNQSVKKIKTDDVQVNSTSATKDNDSYCQTCKAWFTSQIDAAQHYAGKKHAKAIAAASKQESPKKIQSQVPVDQTCLLGIGLNFVPKETQNLLVKIYLFNQKPGATTYGGALRCELCGISTNRLDQLETHRRGTKHIKMVKQKGLLNNNGKVEENQIKTPAVNYAINRTPSGSYYCATCNKSFNCENSFIQHVDSKKHKNQLAIKSFTNQSTQAVVKNKNIKPK